MKRLLVLGLLMVCCAGAPQPLHGQTRYPSAVYLGPACPLTVNDIIKMSRADVKDDAIIAELRRCDQQFQLSKNELARLKNARVSQRVIQAMTAPPSNADTKPAVATPAAPAAPFSLKVDVLPNHAKAGSNFVVKVDLTNITNKRIGIVICGAMRVECNFGIDVRDAQGNAAPATRYLRAVRGEPTGSPNLVSAPSYGPKSIEPGETVQFVSDLSKLYVFNRPGNYTVQVKKSDENEPVVESIPITFTVAPNPHLVPAPEPCTTSADVTVKVTDASGAVLPNAVVIFRPENPGPGIPQSMELKTDGTGLTKASLPCGTADMFVSTNGHSPYTEKVWLGENLISLSVILKP